MAAGGRRRTLATLWAISSNDAALLYALRLPVDGAGLRILIEQRKRNPPGCQVGFVFVTLMGVKCDAPVCNPSEMCGIGRGCSDAASRDSLILEIPPQVMRFPGDVLQQIRRGRGHGRTLFDQIVQLQLKLL